METVQDRVTVLLEGDLTIGNVQKTRSELRDALLRASTVEVRLERVRNMDAAFLQLLCSAHRTAADDGKDFIISGELEQFRAALIRAGFQRHLGCRDNERAPCLWLCSEPH